MLADRGREWQSNCSFPRASCHEARVVPGDEIQSCGIDNCPKAVAYHLLKHRGDDSEEKPVTFQRIESNSPAFPQNALERNHAMVGWAPPASTVCRADLWIRCL